MSRHGPPDSRRPGPHGERNRVQVGGQRDTSTVAETSDDALFGAHASTGYAGVRHTAFTLPDPQDGPRLRDAGLDRARSADPAWARQQLDRAIEDLVAAGKPFTSDDARALVLRHDPNMPAQTTPSSGQVGAAFMNAARAGLIRKTGNYAPTTRTLGRGRALALWVGVRR